MRKKADAPQTPYEELLDHSFVGSVIRNMNPAFAASRKAVEDAAEKEVKLKASKKQSKKSQGTKAPVIPNLTREQEYHDEVFYYVRSMTNIVEDLEEISIYLKRVPISPTFKKQGITLQGWLQYHYANYLTSAVTIYDTALLLTNVVFKLRLSPKSCTEETVAGNRRVQRTKVTAALNKLKEVTKTFRGARNLRVHRGEAPSSGRLDEHESILFIHRAQEKHWMNTEPEMPVRVVETIFRNERRKLIQNFHDTTKDIATAAGELFDAFEPVYSTAAARLR